MTLSRRTLLTSALAAFALPLSAQAAGKAVPLDYKGKDDPEAFQRFMEDQSHGVVAVSVFHAKWCGPCQQLLLQLGEINSTLATPVKIIGLDLGPPLPLFQEGPFKNIVKARGVRATPVFEVLVDGAYNFRREGMLQNVPEMTRYLRELTAALQGTGPAQVRAPAP